MYYKKKISSAILFLMILSGIFEVRIPLLYSLLILFIWSIYDSICNIITVKKSLITVARIEKFEPIENPNIDDNVNFKLVVALLEFEDKQIEVKGLFFKPPKLGKEIKIRINEKDVSNSEIFKGTEITSSILQIISLIIFSIVIAYSIYKNSIF